MAITRSFTGAIALTIKPNYQGAGDLNTAKDVTTFSVTKSFGNGTGADQANRYYAMEIEIDASSSQTVNISTKDGGEDSLGQTLALTGIKALLIENTGDEAIEIGGAASNEWLGFLKAAGDVVKLGAGGAIFVLAPSAAGMAISTDVNLKITNTSGTAATVNLVVIGI